MNMPPVSPEKHRARQKGQHIGNDPCTDEQTRHHIGPTSDLVGSYRLDNNRDLRPNHHRQDMDPAEVAAIDFAPANYKRIPKTTA